MPFHGSPLDILMDKQNKEPRDPGEIVPGIPAELEDFVPRPAPQVAGGAADGHDVLRRLGGTSTCEKVSGVRPVQTAGRLSSAANRNSAN